MPEVWEEYIDSGAQSNDRLVDNPLDAEFEELPYPAHPAERHFTKHRLYKDSQQNNQPLIVKLQNYGNGKFATGAGPGASAFKKAGTGPIFLSRDRSTPAPPSSSSEGSVCGCGCGCRRCVCGQIAATAANDADKQKWVFEVVEDWNSTFTIRNVSSGLYVRWIPDQEGPVFSLGKIYERERITVWRLTYRTDNDKIIIRQAHKWQEQWTWDYNALEGATSTDSPIITNTFEPDDEGERRHLWTATAVDPSGPGLTN